MNDQMILTLLAVLMVVVIVLLILRRKWIPVIVTIPAQQRRDATVDKADIGRRDRAVPAFRAYSGQRSENLQASREEMGKQIF